MRECMWLYRTMPVSIPARGNTEQPQPLSRHPINRFCDECRWNYTLPRSRLRVRIPSAPLLGGRSSMAEHENTFHHPCRRIFFRPATAGRQRMPQVLHWVAGSNPAPATGSSVGRANVPVTSSLHGGPASTLWIDPANAGGTTERKGRGFDSRQPQGCSSADRALRMFHHKLSPHREQAGTTSTNTSE